MVTTQTFKICTTCKQGKPYSDFVKDKQKKDGFRPYCKACRLADYSKNRDKRLSAIRKYRSKNYDKLLAYKRKFNRENSKRLYQDRKEYYKKYCEENKEQIKERRADYIKKYNLQNREKFRIRLREYRQTEKGRSVNKNYKHKRRQLESHDSDITSRWLSNFIASTNNCAICNDRLNPNGSVYPNGKHLDHIIPLYKGGKHTMDNVRVVCFKCNVSRPKDGSDLFTSNYPNPYL